MSSIKTVVTHNGIFHADEVMAIAILQLAFEDNIEVVRTRNQAVIEKADIAVDVGGVYDKYNNKFDHHQIGGAGKRWDTETPYSSCGLVWDFYGAHALYYLGVKEANALSVWGKIDSILISPIDLVDNEGMGVYKNMQHSLFTISQVIGSYNNPSEDQDMAFMEAVSVAKRILKNQIRSANQQAEDQEYLYSAINEQSGNPVLILDKFVAASDETIKEYSFSRVVFPDVSGSWRVKVVPETTMLPQGWGGLNGSDLDNVTGLPGCIFCHRGLFIAGHETKEGAIKLAELSLPILAE